MESLGVVSDSEYINSALPLHPTFAAMFVDQVQVRLFSAEAIVSWNQVSQSDKSSTKSDRTSKYEYSGGFSFLWFKALPDLEQ